MAYTACRFGTSSLWLVWLGLPGLLLFQVPGATARVRCPAYWLYGYQDEYIYIDNKWCDQRCCGDNGHQYCCYDPKPECFNVAECLNVAGAVIGVLMPVFCAIIGVIICLVICCELWGQGISELSGRNVDEEPSNSSVADDDRDVGDDETEVYSSDSDFEGEEAADDVAVVQPYSFEPHASNTVEDVDRLQNTEWCVCGHCLNMPTVAESICCQEIQHVFNTMQMDGVNTCITDHAGFKSVCLDEWVLEVAYSGYRQHYGPLQQQGNKLKRYTAYRQFVRLCWGYLGKDIRVPLPSCAVAEIRKKLPSMDYVGFDDAQ